MSFVFDASKPIALGADHAGIDFKNQVKIIYIVILIN